MLYQGTLSCEQIPELVHGKVDVGANVRGCADLVEQPERRTKVL